MIKTTTKSNKRPTIKYPIVMESASRIILFHAKGKGIVLGGVDDAVVKIGQYDCTCNMNHFIPYDSEIAIQNVR